MAELNHLLAWKDFSMFKQNMFFNVFATCFQTYTPQELPSGDKLDRNVANEFIHKLAQLAESAHETVECTKTLLRTRGVKF